jgi:DNA-binding LytR/AlgR family response regulator
MMYYSDEYREEWLQKTCLEISAMDEELEVMEMSYGQEAVAMDKYEIAAGKKTYYISLEETAYFERYMNKTRAVTADKEISDNLSSSITEIWEAIPEEQKDAFFKTRSQIINGHHVHYTFSENLGRNGALNYVYYAVTSNGDTLKIPNKRFPDFKEHMKNLNLPLQ